MDSGNLNGGGGCHGYGAKGDLVTESAQSDSGSCRTVRYSGPVSLLGVGRRTPLGTNTAGDRVPP